MSKHNGNLDVYGILTVGAAVSGSQYSFPTAIGGEGDGLMVVGGDVVFTNPAPYIDISQTSGGSQLVGDVNYLLTAVNSISGAVDTFAELLDTPKPVNIVDSHEGEIIIVDPNASSQAQKIKYSGVVLSDLVSDVNYLMETSGSGSGIGDITWAEVAAISGGLDSKIDSINVTGVGLITVVESPMNTFTVSISADIGAGPDVTEKLIPIASALLPAISGADLSSKITASGMIFDSVDFASSSEVAYFNFPMSENFNFGSTVYVKMKMTAPLTGTADFQLTVEDLSDTDNWTTSSGHNTISFTHTFTSANVVDDEVVTLLSPTHHDIKQGDLVIISIRRVGGSLLGDASIISLKLTW